MRSGVNIASFVAIGAGRPAIPILLAFLITGCGSSPNAPTPSAVHAPVSLSTFGSIGTTVAVDVGSTLFSRCLSGGQESSCFSVPAIYTRTIPIGANVVGTPLSLVGTVNGSTVTLSWTAPFLSAVSAYVLEAGSAPGLSNLATFSTGNTQTTFSTSGVGAGTYYVRIRAVGTAGEVGQASNEVVLAVGGAGPCTSPGPPFGLAVVSVSGGTVRLAWSPPVGNPTSYVVEAGSASGLANLANSDLGSASPSLTATNVGAGTYYVRIRAKNACGLGGPSNEVVLTVGFLPPPTPRTQDFFIDDYVDSFFWRGYTFTPSISGVAQASLTWNNPSVDLDLYLTYGTCRSYPPLHCTILARSTHYFGPETLVYPVAAGVQYAVWADNFSFVPQTFHIGVRVTSAITAAPTLTEDTYNPPERRLVPIPQSPDVTGEPRKQKQ